MNKQSSYTFPLGFHFSVSFGKEATQQPSDNRFQSVNGLSVEFETETVREGGENRFEHAIPVRPRYSALILKRGLITDSQVIAWCMRAFEDLVIEPTDLTISLLNDDDEPLMSWNVMQAWPTKWEVGDFNAMENAIVIETIQMHYQYFTIES